MKWRRQVQAGLKVQIPKDWAILHSIDRGTPVWIEEQGNELILSFEKVQEESN